MMELYIYMCGENNFIYILLHIEYHLLMIDFSLGNKR